MTILGLRTDGSVTKLYLKLPDGSVVSSEVETARELALRLLEIIHNFLDENGQNINSLSGLVCFAGPGSFTGLRIGHTVMNTLAYSLVLPLTQELGEDWFSIGCTAIEGGEDERIVMPFYGSEPNITKPK